MEADFAAADAARKRQQNLRIDGMEGEASGPFVEPPYARSSAGLGGACAWARHGEGSAHPVSSTWRMTPADHMSHELVPGSPSDKRSSGAM